MQEAHANTPEHREGIWTPREEGAGGRSSCREGHGAAILMLSEKEKARSESGLVFILSRCERRGMGMQKGQGAFC